MDYYSSDGETTYERENMVGDLGDMQDDPASVDEDDEDEESFQDCSESQPEQQDISREFHLLINGK